MKRTFTLMIILLPFMTSCREEMESDNIRTKFSISHPSCGSSYDAGRIIFRSAEQKDENTVAMEKAAEQWKRNMCLRSGYSPLGEYVEKYGQNP